MAAIEQLRSRARALRLDHVEIARRSGLDKGTVGRLLRGAGAIGSTVATLQKVSDVIAAEEAALRDHLATVSS